MIKRVNIEVCQSSVGLSYMLSEIVIKTVRKTIIVKFYICGNKDNICQKLHL